MSRSGALLSFPAQDPPAGDDVRHLAGDHRAPGDLGRGLVSFYAVPFLSSVDDFPGGDEMWDVHEEWWEFTSGDEGHVGIFVMIQ